MIDPTYKPIRLRALIVDDSFDNLNTNTNLGRAVNGLAGELKARDVEVVRTSSFEDGVAVVVDDAAISCVMLNWNLGDNDDASHAQAKNLLDTLRKRREKVPVFLLAYREGAPQTIPIEVAVMTDEFVWILEDTAGFVAGRAIAAMKRYRIQLLPPFTSVLSEYSRVREYSWAAPGHQGGVAFTKHAAGRLFFDFYGENFPHRHRYRA